MNEAMRVRVRAILRCDPAWSAYALADLQPAMDPLCRWTVADEAATMLFFGLEPPVLITVGPPEDVAAALAQTPPARQVYLSVRVEHLPVVRQWYDNRADHRLMWRMALPGETALEELSPARGPGCQPLEMRLLGPADAEQLIALYDHGGPFAPDAFSPEQLEDGVFFGIEEPATGKLLAAGGTHVVNPAESVAAVGNVYTRPDWRRRGCARLVTRGIVQMLRSQGYTTIVLNVDQRNQAARMVYESMGFTLHCPFVEGIAIRVREESRQTDSSYPDRYDIDTTHRTSIDRDSK